jgi:hypothetical protein
LGESVGEGQGASAGKGARDLSSLRGRVSHHQVVALYNNIRSYHRAILHLSTRLIATWPSFWAFDFAASEPNLTTALDYISTTELQHHTSLSLALAAAALNLALSTSTPPPPLLAPSDEPSRDLPSELLEARKAAADVPSPSGGVAELVGAIGEFGAAEVEDSRARKGEGRADAEPVEEGRAGGAGEGREVGV